ncbi:PucR family transcriptional regulator [Actinomadura scrupuli]|uniref:PucR family transcriptional regulator n=1 Tax=Actinomadura scrupuli TaxID=559629 RepID=UPI003D99F64C
MGSDRFFDFLSSRKGLGAEVAAALRPSVPEVARQAVLEIQREIPEYVRPHDPRYDRVLRLAVEYAVGHFIDLMAAPDTPWDEILDFFHQVGAGEAGEGRSLDVWQTSARLAARVAIQHLSEGLAPALGAAPPPSVFGRLTASLFAYLDRIAEAVMAGFAEATERAADVSQSRRALLDLLISEPAVPVEKMTDLAGAAGWAIPSAVAAVAVHEGDGRPTHQPGLPPDVLAGLHLPEPCLIVPDPEGPGRRRMLELGLRGRAAAVGPAVGVTEVRKSLRWARRALALVQRGAISGDNPIMVTEHLPALVILRQPELVEGVAARRLAPLMTVRLRQRRSLAETLQACLECGFNATEVAGRLRMHPQTIRYRLRQLQALFGEDMYDPRLRLELQIVLRAWLAAAEGDRGGEGGGGEGGGEGPGAVAEPGGRAGAAELL